MRAADTHASQRDGISHGSAWSLDALPCAWASHEWPAAVDAGASYASSRRERRDACGAARALEVVGGDLRRCALAHLGCVSGSRAATPAARAAYLAAKAPVDARSRSGTLAAALAARVGGLAARAADGGAKLRVVDVGAGCLSMLGAVAAACAAAGVVSAEYVAVDGDGALLLAGAAGLAGFVERPAPPPPPLSRNVNLRSGAVRVRGVDFDVTLVQADALDFDASPAFDLVVANAFADLVFPETLAGALCRLGRPGAVAYLPITFAGATRFAPPLGAFDEHAFAAYHDHLRLVEKQHVDVDRLVAVLEQHAMAVEAAPSDWAVAVGSGAPDADRAFARYMADFLGAGAAPRFFGTDDAAAAVAWARGVQAAVDGAETRTLRVSNADLLVTFPEAPPVTETRKGRSHRRGDSLSQYLLGGDGPPPEDAA